MRYNHQVKIIIIILKKNVLFKVIPNDVFTNIIAFQKHIDLDTVMWLKGSYDAILSFPFSLECYKLFVHR